MDLKALIAAPLVAAVALVNPGAFEKPAQWSYSSSSQFGPKPYEIGVDPQVTYQGRRALSVRGSEKQGPVDMGIALQYAGGYRGQRVRFSAVVRVAAPDGWGGLLLQAGPEALRHVNAASLPFGTGLRGQAEWTPMSVVIDVPQDARMLSMGLILVGSGQVWASDLKFEVVDPATPLTKERVGVDPQALAEAAQRRRAAQEKSLSDGSGHPPANLQLQP
jgi:hypothetical protein